MNLLGGNIQRNLAINNQLSFKVNLVGLAAGREISLDDQSSLVAYFKIAANLISMGYTQRLSDGLNDIGYSPDLGLESGLNFAKKYRIALGGKVTGILTNPYSSLNNDSKCLSATRARGYSYGGTTCFPTSSSGFLEKRYLATAYALFISEITESISVFGSAEYSIYTASSVRNEFSRSADGAFQFLVGVTQTF